MSPISAVWPGKPYPPGATWDGEGVNFALFSEHAEKVELCLFDPAGRRELQRIEIRERTDQVWHCYLPEARPGMLYGYRVHGPYRPEEGHRFNPHKLLLDPYARNIVGALRWSDALFGYTVGGKREDLSFDRRDSAGGMPKCEVIDPAFTWGDDRRPNDPMERDGHLRAARARLHPAASRGAASAARHVRRPRHRPGDRPPEAARRHHGRADAGPRLRRRPAPGRARAAQLLGLQHHRLLRPGRALLGLGQGERVQDDGEGAALGRHRGDPRRRLQPHRRGQPARADARVPRHRQRLLLPAPRRRSPLLQRLHRQRQHARHAAPARAAAHHGLAALLGDRDARRRLPLRPRRRARARAARGRPPRRLLRHHPPGPGADPGEAHRRAVGPRRRRLPGRQLPAGLGGVERPVPRHDARVLEGRRRPHRRVRAAPHRIERSLRSQRAGGPTRASTSSPRTTASRCAISSPTTRSTTRRTARTTATATTTISRGTAAPRARPTTRRSSRCASGRSATCSRRCFLSQGVPMLLAGDELGRTQDGNNNAYCQDNETQLGRLDARRATGPARSSSCAG